MKNMNYIALGALAVTTLLGACKNEGARAEESTTAPPVASTSPSTDVRPAIERALGVYERIRAKLANDQMAAITADAAELERIARDVANRAPQGQRSQLQQVATGASRLKEMPKDDADAVRRAFGELSRPVVALLSADPSLRTGRHVFECPMAQGYKRWVQTSTKTSNPYMGTRMAECGTEERWESGG